MHSRWTRSMRAEQSGRVQWGGLGGGADEECVGTRGHTQIQGPGALYSQTKSEPNSSSRKRSGSPVPSHVRARLCHGGLAPGGSPRIMKRQLDEDTVTHPADDPPSAPSAPTTPGDSVPRGGRSRTPRHRGMRSADSDDDWGPWTASRSAPSPPSPVPSEVLESWWREAQMPSAAGSSRTDIPLLEGAVLEGTRHPALAPRGAHYWIPATICVGPLRACVLWDPAATRRGSIHDVLDTPGPPGAARGEAPDEDRPDDPRPGGPCPDDARADDAHAGDDPRPDDARASAPGDSAGPAEGVGLESRHHPRTVGRADRRLGNSFFRAGRAEGSPCV